MKLLINNILLHTQNEAYLKIKELKKIIKTNFEKKKMKNLNLLCKLGQN